jgi:hypothetical protein
VSRQPTEHAGGLPKVNPRCSAPAWRTPGYTTPFVIREQCNPARCTESSKTPRKVANLNGSVFISTRYAPPYYYDLATCYAGNRRIAPTRRDGGVAATCVALCNTRWKWKKFWQELIQSQSQFQFLGTGGVGRVRPPPACPRSGDTSSVRCGTRCLQLLSNDARWVTNLHHERAITDCPTKGQVLAGKQGQ